MIVCNFVYPVTQLTAIENYVSILEEIFGSASKEIISNVRSVFCAYCFCHTRNPLSGIQVARLSYVLAKLVLVLVQMNLFVSPTLILAGTGKRGSIACPNLVQAGGNDSFGALF